MYCLEVYCKCSFFAPSTRPTHSPVLIELHAVTPGRFVLGHLEIICREAKWFQDAIAELHFPIQSEPAENRRQ